MGTSKRSRTALFIGVPILILVVIGLVLALSHPSSAQVTNLTARLSEILGLVQVRNNPQAQYNQVVNGFILKQVMQLQTKEQSKVRLDLSTGTIVRLGQSTVFSLDTPTTNTNGLLSLIELQTGKIWVVLRGGSLDVNTPRGIASVRGSYMSVWVKSNSNEIIVCCLEGTCTYQNGGGIVNLTTGQKIVSSDMSVKPEIQPMDPSDMQDWSDNSPEAAAIVSQVATLEATSTPTFAPSPIATYTPSFTTTPTPTGTADLIPGLAGTPGISTTPYPTYYLGFDPAMVQKCLSYGYTSQEMYTCLINLAMTLTPLVKP